MSMKVWYTPVICDQPITSDGGDLRVFRAEDIIERMRELCPPLGMAAWELLATMEVELNKAVEGEAPKHVQRETLSGL
jgi:hypothetical protein